MADERLSVWRDRRDVQKLSQAELMATMLAEADASGLEPADCQDDGTPNIYFRTRWRYYDDGTVEQMGDGYQMPVRERTHVEQKAS